MRSRSRSPISGAHYYYNPYFDLYSTTPDILRYDDALFGGKLLSPTDLQTLLSPRDASPDPGIPDARWAYKWKVGHLAGQQVIFTYDTTDNNLTTINMRFPWDGTSVIVISNDKVDDAEPIGVNLAKMVYGQAVVYPVAQGRIPSVSPYRAIQATIGMPTSAALPAFADHAVWLPNDSFNTVTRVSARTDRIAGVTPLSPSLVGHTGDALSVAAGGGQVWVVHDGALEVVRLDPTTGKVIERVHTGGPDDISVAHGIVWGTQGPLDDVVRIDPRTHTVTHLGHRFGTPYELAAGGDSVWVSSRQPSLLRRIDVRTNQVVATIPVGTDAESVALGFGSVWVANGTGGYVSRIDPRTKKVIAQIAVGHDELAGQYGGGPCCHGIAVGYGAVWVAVHKDHKLVRIDPRTNRATSQLTIPLPANVGVLHVWDVMVGDGSVWVHAEPHQLFRIDPKVMGEHVTLGRAGRCAPGKEREGMVRSSSCGHPRPRQRV
jgi:streptogramin lyase